MKKRYLEAGRIVNTHGVKGEIRIEPWADSAEFLLGFETIYIDERPVRMLNARAHKRFVIAGLEGVDDVSAAMSLKNKTVFIDRHDKAVPEGCVFMQDILGAEVKTENGECVGRLEDFLDMPASKVYVVRGERELLIPDVPEFILDVDAENAVITVRLIEGM